MARLFDDGSSQYLSLTQVPVGANPSTVSMACWYNTDNDAAQQVLMQMYDTGGNNQYNMGLRGDAGDIVQCVEWGNTALASANTTATYSLNTWEHIVSTFDSGTTRKCYLNGGNMVSDVVDSGTMTSLNDTLIGCNKRISAFVSGAIAEAAIWSAVLTDAEVAILALGYSPLLVRPQSRVAYWPLIGRTSPEIDLVGGYDMTLNAGPTVAAHSPVRYPYYPQYGIRAAADTGLSVNISPGANYIQVV